MRSILCATIATGILIAPIGATAGEREFCAGFSEGYKTIKGDMVIVPICHYARAPMTPVSSTDFREGIKAGMAAARTERPGTFGRDPFGQNPFGK